MTEQKTGNNKADVNIALPGVADQSLALLFDSLTTTEAMNPCDLIAGLSADRWESPPCIKHLRVPLLTAASEGLNCQDPMPVFAAGGQLCLIAAAIF